MSDEIQNHVITFYSYKGGTGRTMALANVACLLAKQVDEKGVLMIDWDLEAPGLHRFFEDRFAEVFSEKEGLIDLFDKLNKTISANYTKEQPQTEDEAYTMLESFDLEKFILKVDVEGIESLYLLKAGRFDDKYSDRVNTFSWEGFYKRSPSIFRLLAERLTRKYQYVLIDSRTGITDISGICTTLMPDKLVVVFTPNRQSLTGLKDMIRKAANYRRQSDDLRPLSVFPLPSRIEFAESELRKDWRYGKDRIEGYQPLFEKLFKEIYALPKCNLEGYFNEVQVQHIPRYAYGEEIAVLVERSGDRLSLTRSYESFTRSLVNFAGPWEYVIGKTGIISIDGSTVEIHGRKTEDGELDACFVYGTINEKDVVEVALTFMKRQRNLLLIKWDSDIYKELSKIDKTKLLVFFIGKDQISPQRKVKMQSLMNRFHKTNSPIVPVILGNVIKLPTELRAGPKYKPQFDLRKSSIDEVIDELELLITEKQK